MPATPVDQIMSREFDAVAEAIDACADRAKLAEAVRTPENREAMARGLLCKISHAAGLPRVLATLAAVGGPTSLEQIGSMLDGVIAVRRLELTGDAGVAGGAAGPATPANDTARPFKP